jgi:ribosomal-protein-alanine N-acetyltransferase
MSEPPTILETARLRMRRLVPADLDALFALYRDPLVRQHFPEGTLTYEETREELEWFLDGHPRHSELGLWATLDRATGAFLGRCGLLPWTIDGRDEVEVAYLLDPAVWGRGLATEAARGILRHGFERLGLARIICLPLPENAASRRVAEKAGLTLEREVILDGDRALLFAAERDAWLAANRAAS